MVSFSKVLSEIRSTNLAEGRGLRMVGQVIKTRDSRDPGREWFQIGRIWSQSDAVRLIEAAIDDALGPGEGQKLLRETGAADRWYGARITKEKAEQALLQAQDEKRIRNAAMAGQRVRFCLKPERMEKVQNALRQDFAEAKQAQEVSEQAIVDLPRTTIELVQNGVRRNISEEAREKFDGDVDKIVTYHLQEIKAFVNEEPVAEGNTNEKGIDAGEEIEAVNERRYLSVISLLYQRTLGPAGAEVNDLLEGDVGKAPGRRSTAFVINKMQAESGQFHFRFDCMTIKNPAAHFFKKGGPLKEGGNEVIELKAEESFFYLTQPIEVSSADLAKPMPTVLKSCRRKFSRS